MSYSDTLLLKNLNEQVKKLEEEKIVLLAKENDLRIQLQRVELQTKEINFIEDKIIDLAAGCVNLHIKTEHIKKVYPNFNMHEVMQRIHEDQNKESGTTETISEIRL